MKKKKTKKITQLEIIKNVRRTWTINPITKIFKDKSKYFRKKKYKENIDEKTHHREE